MIVCRRICSLLILVLAALSASAGAADIKSEVTKATRSFKDITLTCKVVYANHTELRKIGKDFGKSYDFKTTTVRYKAPTKMKIEGKLGMMGAKIVMNGDRKATMIPALHISKKEDIAKEPHKRQTDFDLGIFSESFWQEYKVLKVDDVQNGQVYTVTFIRENSREKKNIVWVDATSLKMLKLEKYESDGSMKVRYIYSKHSLIDGLIWVPGRVDVYSPGGKLAGTSEYERIKINTNIPDSEFKI